jgi:hypothetical protein
MIFSDDILKTIIKMGASGKTETMIALELNMSPDQLDVEKEKNEKLNEALTKAQSNAERFQIAKLEADCLNGRNPAIAKDMYQRLIQKHSNNDNEITIKRYDT